MTVREMMFVSPLTCLVGDVSKARNEGLESILQCVCNGAIKCEAQVGFGAFCTISTFTDAYHTGDINVSKAKEAKHLDAHETSMAEVQ